MVDDQEIKVEAEISPFSGSFACDHGDTMSLLQDNENNLPRIHPKDPMSWTFLSSSLRRAFGVVYENNFIFEIVENPTHETQEKLYLIPSKVGRDSILESTVNESEINISGLRKLPDNFLDSINDTAILIQDTERNVEYCYVVTEQNLYKIFPHLDHKTKLQDSLSIIPKEKVEISTIKNNQDTKLPNINFTDSKIRTSLLNTGQCLSSDPNIQGIYDRLDKIAQTDLSVIIAGDSGAGKEALARATHDASPRANKPFVVLDGSSKSSELIQSELYGHTKGAYTGAVSAREGLLNEANGGTLFIDELAHMPKDIQPKLLRFLSTGEYSKLGSTKVESSDVRIVSAYNKPIDFIEQDDDLLLDLYYRLNQFQVHLPRLSERNGDIIELADHFARLAGKQIEQDATKIILSHQWPGNVRELENTIKAAVALSDDATIKPQDIIINGRMTQATSYENYKIAPNIERIPSLLGSKNDTGTPPIEFQPKNSIYDKKPPIFEKPIEVPDSLNENIMLNQRPSKFLRGLMQSFERCNGMELSMSDIMNTNKFTDNERHLISKYASGTNMTEIAHEQLVTPPEISLLGKNLLKKINAELELSIYS